MGTEPGGADLPHLLAAECRVLLPVLLPDGDLDWAAFTPAADHPHPASAQRVAGPGGNSGSTAAALVAGPRGVLEPTGPRLGVDAITTADLVLVPALAVDRRGMRLGKGGGSYDRALARVTVRPDRRPLIVALLHEGEFIDHTPAEPHDRRVDAALTPGGHFRLNPAVEWTK